jgi:hypothetical protein
MPDCKPCRLQYACDWLQTELITDSSIQNVDPTLCIVRAKSYCCDGTAAQQRSTDGVPLAKKKSAADKGKQASDEIRTLMETHPELFKRGANGTHAVVNL